MGSVGASVAFAGGMLCRPGRCGLVPGPGRAWQSSFLSRTVREWRRYVSFKVTCVFAFPQGRAGHVLGAASPGECGTWLHEDAHCVPLCTRVNPGQPGWGQGQLLATNAQQRPPRLFSGSRERAPCRKAAARDWYGSVSRVSVDGASRRGQLGDLSSSGDKDGMLSGAVLQGA